MSHGVAWLIGGTAGEGVESGGEAFATALAAAGYRPTTGRDFPSRIRGGDTTYTVRLTPEGHLVPPTHIDVAVVFNATVVPRLHRVLGPSSLLLVDGKVGAVDAPCEAVAFPFTQLAEAAGTARAKNVVALGASAALLGVPMDRLRDAIADRFRSKGDAVVQTNVAALQAGFDACVARFGGVRYQAPAPEEGPALFLSGNQAACLGALEAGVQTAAAYPITPASDILEFLTPRLLARGGVALQMEDEMAALNVCIGSGFAGVPALTATSGPGLSLMTETLGLAESTETPVVIIDCQRPGPSTGMPTKHAQDDVWHLAHGGHGEGVRVVLAPTDVRDAHRTTAQAFALAARYHCPALVAMDQQISLMKQTVAPFDAVPPAFALPEPSIAGDAWDKGYLPYGDDGGAPVRRAVPGGPGVHLSNSTEHGPDGLTTEDPQVRTAMMDRRLARLAAIVDTTEDAVVVHGPPADTVLVSFGSTVGSCLEAQARRDGVRVVAVRLLWPFPTEAVRDAIGDASRVVVAEANAMGQFESLLKAALPLHDRIRSARRYDGTPVRSDDVLAALEAP